MYGKMRKFPRRPCPEKKSMAGTESVTSQVRLANHAVLTASYILDDVNLEVAANGLGRVRKRV